MDSCSYSSVPIEATKSARVTKTNTLHQFDTADIIGLPSPVGKLPIVFYTRESCNSGRRGIVYFNDRDTVCWMYPESEHAEWCKKPYDLIYDALEPWSNEIERGWRRNHGIFEIWVNIWNHYYNGQIMYRPEKRIQGCGRRDGGYPSQSEVITVEEKTRNRTRTEQIKPNKRRSKGCNCGKGV